MARPYFTAQRIAACSSIVNERPFGSEIAAIQIRIEPTDRCASGRESLAERRFVVVVGVAVDMVGRVDRVKREAGGGGDVDVGRRFKMVGIGPGCCRPIACSMPRTAASTTSAACGRCASFRESIAAQRSARCRRRRASSPRHGRAWRGRCGRRSQSWAEVQVENVRE